MIEQEPPADSACKVNGDRAYTLMRKGRDVELKPKTLRIDDIELTSFAPETMQMSIRVVCGKGTYIRALARDIGQALGSGAYLTALRFFKLPVEHGQGGIHADRFYQLLVCPDGHGQFRI